jgi:hypothetical protein
VLKEVRTLGYIEGMKKAVNPLQSLFILKTNGSGEE